MIARSDISCEVYPPIKLSAGAAASHIDIKGQLGEERGSIEGKEGSQEGERESKFFEHLLVLLSVPYVLNV